MLDIFAWINECRIMPQLRTKCTRIYNNRDSSKFYSFYSSIYNGTNCEEIIYLTGDTNCYIKLNNFF